MTVVAAAAMVMPAAVAGPAYADSGERPIDSVSSVGSNGVVARILGLRRESGHLELTVGVAAYGEMILSWPFVSDDALDASVLDPATGRAGVALADQDDCRCSTLPVYLRAGQEYATTLEIADPGGDTLDVLIASFTPIQGIPVTGDAASSTTAVRTLQPRSRTPLARSRTGAARSTGSQIDLDTDVLFAFGKSTLSDKAQATLEVAADALKAQDKRKLSVYGYTDGKGGTASNQTLSLKRAEAVQAALAPLLGDGWTFDVKGFGESKPVAAETTEDGDDYPEGRALNRRVELTVQD